MTANEAMERMSHLVGGIPGFNDEAVDVYVAAFQRLDDPGALDDVCTRMAATWVSAWRPSLGEVLREYSEHPSVRAAVRRRQIHVVPAVLPHCDGTGWIRLDGGPRPDSQYAPIEDYRPCPRCNPYVSDVHADPERWARYLAGTPLYELHDNVKLARSGPMTVEGGAMPPRCKVDHSYDDAAISLDEYLRRLSVRAAAGDDAAAEEHARFVRHRQLFEAGLPVPEEAW